MPDESGRQAADALRPLAIWKSMDAERRLKAATAFWKSEGVKGVEKDAVAIALAPSLHFRPQSIRTAPMARRASWLAGFHGITDQIASQLLYAYHMDRQVPLMARFLDALEIRHQAGRIDESVAPQASGALEKALDAVLKEFDPADVAIYVKTLASQDDEAWGALPEILKARSMI